jgi:hypothetical protein
MLVLHLPAQQPPAVGGSTVFGHVICADNNEPAHFARVLLKSTAPSHTAEDRMKQVEAALQQGAAKNGEPVKPLTAEQKRTMAESDKFMASMTNAENRAAEMSSAVTAGLDGAFTLTGVKPGTYYVHAVYNGYLDPVSQLSDKDFASTDPAVRARIAQLPTVTVNGADSARADLRLERGAAISGRILYDDGSPATGWTVSVIQPNSPEEQSNMIAAVANMQLAESGAAEIPKTDDLGHYRIPALPPGEYAVRAVFFPININYEAILGNGSDDADDSEVNNPFGGGIDIAVYSGDTFFRSDAKPIKLTDGEDLPAVDITIPARNLHRISGHVVAKSDGHSISHGMLMLTSKDKPLPMRMSSMRSDGSFRFECVPNGNTYVLHVMNVEDVKPAAPGKARGIVAPRSDVLQEYGEAQATVTLGEADIDTLSISVSPVNRTPTANKPAVTPPDDSPTSGDSSDQP